MGATQSRPQVPASEGGMTAGCAFARAVVIDDDPLFQIVLTEALRAGGVQHVETASDGMQGLQLVAAADQKPDLIALDLQMPNMTGVDVVRELARAEFTGALIIISSEDSRVMQSVQTLARLSEINILGSLGKPLDVAALHDLLKRAQPRPSQVGRTIITRQQVRAVLAQDKLVPFYQPKIRLADGAVTGFEILTRLDGADPKAPAPSQFLDAIEKFGLSVDFLCSTIQRTAKDTRDWDARFRALKLAFNLTPLAFQDPRLPNRLLECVRSAGLDPRAITFEITENHLLECTAESLEVLSLLRLYGFALSIDDFGTGATSAEQLRTFPFTELKIDGRFMLHREHDEFSRLTVQTSANQAAMLGMSVVAEGVESPEAIRFAHRAGAHEVQGFYFARAMSASRTLAWLRAYRTDDAMEWSG